MAATDTATRDAILRAARRLFVEHGFAGASLSDVADAAGVTKSLIHHHFGSKQELWKAVKLACFTDYHHQQKPILVEHRPDLALLRDSLSRYFDHLRQQPDAARLQAWLFLEGDHCCNPNQHELLELGVQRLSEGQAGGLLRPDIPPAYILAVALGAIERWFQDRAVYIDHLPPGSSPEQIDDGFRDALLKLLVEGLLPATTSASEATPPPA